MRQNQRYMLKKVPVQQRSRFLVKTIKEAATRVLLKDGVDAFNTNRIAERAGVSIGSLYQYFPSKDVLIAEIKRDHILEIRNQFERLSQRRPSPTLQTAVDNFIDATLLAHLVNPELHKIMMNELGHIDVKKENPAEKDIKRLVEQVLEQYRTTMRDDLDISAACRLCCLVVENTIHELINTDATPQRRLAVIKELKTMVVRYLT